MRSGGNFSTNDDMKTELQYSTNIHSERSTLPDAKPVLPAVASTVVYLEDCVQALKRFDDNYFDVAIVDPPYGIGRSGQTETFTKNPKHKRKHFADKGWDTETPASEYWNELFRVSKNQIVWGAACTKPLLCVVAVIYRKC